MRLGLALAGVLLVAATGTGDPVRFVKVKGGSYRVGEAGHLRNPLRTVKLAGFEIGVTEVTNAQFESFIQATSYVTDAEKNGFGMTFREGMEDWKWESTRGADWRHPFGPASEMQADHPVTQISFNDATAYCRWAGGRLPTVEEWEVAARAGAETPLRWPWGNVYSPRGRFLANTWQGPSHRRNTMKDGYLYTAPVAQFPPNAWGLYDVIGNVFEYCTDARSGGMAAGRGGSWWCSEGTCDFYNLIDIGRMHPRATLPNQGFRVVRVGATGSSGGPPVRLELLE